MIAGEGLLTQAGSSWPAAVGLAAEQQIEFCYHCHKCTSGCPVAGEMEYGPDRVLRLVQLGEKDRVLASRDIWLCAGCETCGTRCPNGIDIAAVMDALRAMALSEGRAGRVPAAKFHRLFLLVVQNMGRMHEAILLGAYKLWSGHIMDDLDSAVPLVLKGKIPLMPHLMKQRGSVKRLFGSAGSRRKESGKKG